MICPHLSRRCARYFAALTAATFSTASGADITPPVLSSLQFSPGSIDTSSGPAQVKLNFTAGDDSSGANYFEAVFSSPTEGLRRSAVLRYAPTLHGSFSATAEFPRFSSPGTWTLSQVLLSDAAGNTAQYDSNKLAQLGVATRLNVLGSQDSIPPKLNKFDFTPVRIDTTAGAVNVKASFAATDDLSGVNHVEVVFASPSGRYISSGPFKMPANRSLSGEMSLAFPRRSEAGQWRLHSIFVADAAGNTRTFDTAELSSMGVRTALDVIATEDNEAPSLASLHFAPDSIDTSNGPALVEVSVRATDAVSGIQSIEVVFGGPTEGMTLTGRATYPAVNEVNGPVTVMFPRGSTPGQWTVIGVQLVDAAGNTFGLSRDEVLERGINGVLYVKGVLDTAPPQLISLSMKPVVIDTSRSPAAVEVTVVASDDLSGVRSIEVVFVNPSESARVRGSVTLPPRTEAKATIRVSFPAHSEPGEWRAESAVLTDAAGNTQSFDSDALAVRVGRLRVQ